MILWLRSLSLDFVTSVKTTVVHLENKVFRQEFVGFLIDYIIIVDTSYFINI